jgi:peptide/nickel transport system ATP-binding protein
MIDPCRKGGQSSPNTRSGLRPSAEPRDPGRNINPMPLLEVRDLRVRFGLLGAVEDLSFRIYPGEGLGIVGESGCGKSATARAIMGLYRSDPRCQVTGQVLLNGVDLISQPERRMQKIRGRHIAMVFQDPLTCLNPLQRIGTQIAEMLHTHTDLSTPAIRKRTIELLQVVGIPHPEERVDAYPHQFSGGMRQRVMIALAIACNPSLLIADEPTTALDVTTQMQILRLLAELRGRTGMAIILITHNFNVVAEMSDRILVMYAGQCVESAKTSNIFGNPQHPYTAALLASIPLVDMPRLPRLPSISGSPPLLAGDRPSGCSFRPRCAISAGKCLEPPPLVTHNPEHLARCWFPGSARKAAPVIPAEIAEET